MNKIRQMAVSETGFLFDPHTGNTFILNETAVIIFNLLRSDKTADEIQATLTADYEVEPGRAARDISDMVIQLRELGLYE